MKIHGGADYEALSREEDSKSLQVENRPDLSNVLKELFAAEQFPVMPEGWDTRGVSDLANYTRRDGEEAEPGYCAWVFCKSLHGTPHVDWQRKGIGIWWSSRELKDKPLGILRGKLRQALEVFVAQAVEFPEGGALPLPTIV